MASTIETFDFAIKDRFDKVSHVANLTLSERPLLAMIDKDEDFQGDGTHIPLIYGNPQGIAAQSLSIAQTVSSNDAPGVVPPGGTQNGGNVRGKKFILTAGVYQGSVSIGDKVITASRGNPGALLRNKAAEMDGLYEQMADNIATYLYGNSGNALGRVGVIDEAGESITLSDPSQSISFEVGMVLTFSDADGTGDADAQHGAPTTAQVVAVDRATGVITFIAGEVTALIAAGLLVNDFIFRYGDFAGDTGTFIFHGLSDFLWGDATPPPDIYSMTRTDDRVRLAGSFVPAADLAGLNIEERIQMLGAYMTGRYRGPGPSHGFMNPEDWQNLSISLQSRGVRPLKDDTTRFNFMALEVVMGGKMVRIYPDRFCPRGTFFALRLKDWTLHSMLKLIHPISQDGLVLLRSATSNQYEYRTVSYPAVCCVAPGWSGRAGLSVA